MRALGYLSPKLAVGTARELLPTLADAAAAGNYAPPRLTDAGADIELDVSGRELRPTGRLPAAALVTAARLAAAAAIDHAELPSLALAALNSPHDVMRSAALGVYQELAGLPLPEGLERCLTDEAARVRAAALRLLVTRDPDALRSPAVMAMTSDDDVSVRLALLELARTNPRGEPTLAALAADDHCLLRKMATTAHERRQRVPRRGPEAVVSPVICRAHGVPGA